MVNEYSLVVHYFSVAALLHQTQHNLVYWSVKWKLCSWLQHYSLAAHAQLQQRITSLDSFNQTAFLNNIKMILWAVKEFFKGVGSYPKKALNRGYQTCKTLSSQVTSTLTSKTSVGNVYLFRKDKQNYCTETVRAWYSHKLNKNKNTKNEAVFIIVSVLCIYKAVTVRWGRKRNTLPLIP